MFHLFLYAGAGYIFVGTVVYTFGHPRLQRPIHILDQNSDESVTLKESIFYRQLAHSAQAMNFVFSKASISMLLPRRRRGIRDSYVAAVREAFDPKKQTFITTGAPHARAYYLRNFAWFYPTLLDPVTILDGTDRENRVILLAQSIETILEAVGSNPYPTTLIPLGKTTMSAVNYVTPPSDSLLGVLTGIEQLAAGAPTESNRLLSVYGTDLQAQAEYFLTQLKEVGSKDMHCAVLDSDEDRSTATDTRRERLRFVVAANVWTSLTKAVDLGVIGEKRICECLGYGLAEYKRQILKVFGTRGYIQDSLDTALSANDAGAITLDFAHIHDGFWDFSTPEEIALFKATADRLLSDPHFADDSGDAFFISRDHTRYGFIHRLTVPDYQGRTVWPNFNVAFAERLLALANTTGEIVYRDRAKRILLRLKAIIERNGGYPELLNAHGGLYRTWIYRSAIANSWFPYFATVWHEAFDESIIGE